MERDEERFRSFAERYVVARAQHFDTDPKVEEEQAWACILRAKSVYKQIEMQAGEFKPQPEVNTQVGIAAAPNFPLAVPAKRPLNAYRSTTQTMAANLKKLVSDGSTPASLVSAAYKQLCDVIIQEDKMLDGIATAIHSAKQSAGGIGGATGAARPTKKPWWMP